MPKRAVGKRRVLSLLLSIWSLCLMGMIFWTLSKGFAGRGYPPLLLFTLNASLKAGHQNPKNLPVGIWWNKCWAPDCYYWGRCLEEGGALAAPFRSHHLHHLHHCYHHFGRPSFSIESLGFRVTLSGFVYDTVLVQREGGGSMTALSLWTYQDFAFWVPCTKWSTDWESPRPLVPVIPLEVTLEWVWSSRTFLNKGHCMREREREKSYCWVPKSCLLKVRSKSNAT